MRQEEEFVYLAVLQPNPFIGSGRPNAKKENFIGIPLGILFFRNPSILRSVYNFARVRAGSTICSHNELEHPVRAKTNEPDENKAKKKAQTKERYRTLRHSIQISHQLHQYATTNILLVGWHACNYNDGVANVET